jgi:hypothetical protein
MGPRFRGDDERVALVFNAFVPIHISNSKDRHCGRSEAIQLSFLSRDGLLRCARNDGKTHLRDPAA